MNTRDYACFAVAAVLLAVGTFGDSVGDAAETAERAERAAKDSRVVMVVVGGHRHEVEQPGASAPSERQPALIR